MASRQHRSEHEVARLSRKAERQYSRQDQEREAERQQHGDRFWKFVGISLVVTLLLAIISVVALSLFGSRS